MKHYGKSKAKKNATGSFAPPSSDAKHIGGNSFPDGKPVCDSIRPGRRVKPLSGPVHPGFPKANSTYNKKKTTKPPAVLSSGIKVADQNNDLYKPLRKVNPKKKKKRSTILD